MSRLALGMLLATALVASACAQIWLMSPSGGGRAAGSGVPLVACGAVGLDFTTACGTTQYLVILR